MLSITSVEVEVELQYLCLEKQSPAEDKCEKKNFENQFCQILLLITVKMSCLK